MGKRKVKIFVKKFRKIFSPYLRIFFAFFSLVFIVVLAFQALRDIDAYEITEAAYVSENINNFHVEDATFVASPSGLEFEVNIPKESEITHAEKKYAEKMQKIEEEKRRLEEAKRREKMVKVNALAAFLQRMGSPMAPYSEVIIDSCMVYGAHFCKYFLSIAGVESGFGRVSLGCCNAWGIMHLRWASWNDSIPAASNWIASRYFLRGYDTFEKLANTSYHGGSDEAKKIWVGNLYSFYYKIPL